MQLLLILYVVWISIATVYGQFVSLLNQDFTFTCPDNTAIISINSSYDTNINDRQWLVFCSSINNIANYSNTCNRIDNVNTIQDDLTLNCPDNSFLGGLESTIDVANADRIWSFFCCKRNSITLLNCSSSTPNWDNSLRQDLNYVTKPGHVIRAVDSYYSKTAKDRRWRFEQCYLQLSCGDPGQVANAVRLVTDYYYNFTVTYSCIEGYYQVSGPVGGVRRCTLSGSWSSELDPIICTACSQITNCVDIRCTTMDDQICYLCESFHGYAPGQSAFLNTGVSCDPLCSWRHAYCYPGMCSNLSSTCQCINGYTGPDCLIIEHKPTIISCSVSIQPPGNSLPILNRACVNNSTTVDYINYIPERIYGNWASLFIGPTTPLPNYVNDYSIGVSDARFIINIARAISPNTERLLISYTCQNLTNDSPGLGLVNCNVSTFLNDLTVVNVFHGDILSIYLTSVSGGYLDLNNVDSSSIDRVYYNGNATNLFTQIQIDIYAPTHCSVLTSQGACYFDMLHINQTITRARQVKVTWGGWMDFVSGISHYSLELYQLVSSPLLGYLTETLVPIWVNSYIPHNRTDYTMDIMLSMHGPHSVILKVFDFAGNVRSARRLVYYDDDSILKMDPFSPLKVISGTSESNYTFQNNLSPSPITISGMGHFYNDVIRNNPLWLGPVSNHSDVAYEYDDDYSSGIFPRTGVLHSEGVVELYIFAVTDTISGTSMGGQTPPNIFTQKVENFSINSVEIDVPRSDGETITIWFQAVDFLGHTARSNVRVHIDSSAPEITSLALYKNGIGNLRLFGSKSFTDLTFEMTSFDQHSSISTIHWSLYLPNNNNNNYNDSISYGWITIPNYNNTICQQLTEICVCDPHGVCTVIYNVFGFGADDFTASSRLTLHDTDYRLEITVINRASVSYRSILSFTVDHTPPTQGYILESSGPLIPDIDYQGSLMLTARWGQFFDPETDILLYQYTVTADRCQNDSIFSYPRIQNSTLNETTNTQESIPVTGDGRYYFSVVAYNKALLATQPVCSDGIIIDRKPPVLSDLKIEALYTREGLIKTQSGEVWLVTESFERIQISNADIICQQSALLYTNINIIPIATLYSAIDCNVYAAFSNQFYLRNFQQMGATWYLNDDYGIDNIFTGIGTSSNIDFSVVHQIPSSSTNFITDMQTDGLISQGSSVYYYIAATDLANNNISISFGPINIDITPPIWNSQSDLTVAINSTHVSLLWPVNAFTDPEDSHAYTYYLTIGATQWDTDIMSTHKIRPTTCNNAPTYLCYVTPLKGLIEGHTYTVSIRAANTVQLFGVSWAFYTYNVKLPVIGALRDINPYATPIYTDPTQSLSFHCNDIDTLVFNDSVTVQWYSSPNEILPVTYSVGISTEEQDIILLIATNSNRSHTFYNLSLTDGMKYYSVVRATNAVGSVYAYSDGFTIHTSPQVITVYNSHSYTNKRYTGSLYPVTASWRANSNASYFSHYRWALLLLSNQSIIVEWQNIGDMTHIIYPHVTLEPGIEYISAVQFCHSDGCDISHLSEPFVPITPPVATPLTAIYYADTNEIYLEWATFQGAGLAYYEWSIGTSYIAGGQLLVDWQILSESANNTISLLYIDIQYTDTIYATLYGYNKAGQSDYSITELLIVTAANPMPIPHSSLLIEPIIYDVIPNSIDILLDDYDNFYKANYKDIDYIATTDSYSAIWPTLRYSIYHYSLSETKLYICNDVTQCGTVFTNYMSTSGLALQHAHTYYLCVKVYRNDTLLGGNYFLEASPEYTVYCSDGVTTDLFPPISNCVTLQSMHTDMLACYSNSIILTAATRNLYAIWNSFTDLESQISIPYITGLAYYEIGLGTTPGSIDILEYTKIGLTNSYHFKSSLITHGKTYYVTLRAYDLAGQVTVVTSNGMRVDLTPPTVNYISLYPRSILAVISTLQNVTWSSPYDAETPISTVSIAAGTKPGYSDIFRYRQLESTADTYRHMDFSLQQEGDVIFISLLIVNEAGLHYLVQSMGYPVDFTPPVPGTVLDGLSQSDMTYTDEANTLSAHWTNWFDPHSYLSDYSVAIGSCVYCDDLVHWHSVGLTNEFSKSLSNLLIEGKWYFVSVQGCNILGLCSVQSSNGILIDQSPPTIGTILDGPGLDVQYQLQTSLISASWNGFYDRQSAISYYNILIMNSTHALTDSIYISSVQTSFSYILDHPLIESSRIFVLIRAYNHVDQVSSLSSDGVTIATGSPVFTSLPQVNTSWAGRLDNETTQISSKILLIHWLATINHPYTNFHITSYVMLNTNTNSYPISTINQLSDIFQSVYPNAYISDGQLVSASIYVCSLARTCLWGVSPAILVDSTPPTSGTFVTVTNTSAELSWVSQDSVISWSGSAIHLAWTGFSDIHSGINEYSIKIGTSLANSDLTGGHISYKTDKQMHSVIYLQVSIVRELTENEIIYISITARNGVGLWSPIVEKSFLVHRAGTNSSGTLELLRSTHCLIETCMGHCTCAEVNEYCPRDTSTCLDVTSMTTPIPVIVTSYQALRPTSVVYIGASDYIHGRWGHDPLVWFYEYSYGVLGEELGLRGWKYVGQRQDVVISLAAHNNLLMPNISYYFHIRAWYNYTKYAIYSSDTFMYLGDKPAFTPLYPLREVTYQSAYDIDFIDDINNMNITWNGSFPHGYPNYGLEFDIGAGLLYRMNDLMALTRTNGNSYQFNPKYINNNVKFYSSLLVTNVLGFQTYLTTDGITIDTFAPFTGQVMDGTPPFDLDYQSHLSSISCWYYGFSDPISYIRNYEISIIDLNGTIVRQANDSTYILNSYATQLQLSIGHTYICQVIAIDGSGRQSVPIKSDGVTITGGIQSLAMTLATQEYIKNPSFDNVLTFPICDQYSSQAVRLEFWDISGTSFIDIQTFSADNDYFIPYHSCSSVAMVGTISQSVTLVSGTTYLLSFYTAVHSFTCNRQLSFYSIKLSVAHNIQKVFRIPIIHSTPDLQFPVWHKSELIFTPVTDVNIISLTTLTKLHSILIDSISIRGVILTPPTILASYFISDTIRVSQLSIPSVPVTTLTVSWAFLFTPPESDNEAFYVAVGYTPGGEQILPYYYTGNGYQTITPFFTTPPPGSQIYVSVMALSVSGRQLPNAYSRPITVEEMPISLLTNQIVTDGLPDLAYTSIGEISVSWAGLDNNDTGLNNVVRRLWGVGTTPGSDDVIPFREISDITNNTYANTTINSVYIQHGVTVYSTIYSINKIGVTVKGVSNGVTFLLKPPENKEAWLEITNGETIFPYSPLSNYLSTTNVIVSWSGFEEYSTILTYSYNIAPLVTSWVDVATSKRIYLTNSQLMAHVNYTLTIRATNPVGLYSDISDYFMVILDDVPIQRNAIQTLWRNDGSLLLNWTGSFESNFTPLRYELHLSDRIGLDLPHNGLGITTMNTQILLNPEEINIAYDYELNLVAIATNGMYKQTNLVIPGLII